MPSIRTILFPFDFSAAGMRAAPYVRTLAGRMHAKIILLSVLPPFWIEPAAGIALIGEEPEKLRVELKARLDAALTQQLAGLQVERVTVTGDPAAQITAFAGENGVDLIMMPTHGCGLFRSLLIGSVTAKVLHDTKCPVWTAAHAENQHARELPKTILCALDGTPQSSAELTWAAEFCRQTEAALTLLHVVQPASDWLALESERELQEELRREAQSRIELIQQSTGFTAPLRVAVGEIAATIAEEARQQGADLILLGRGASQSTLGRLRSHTYRIIENAPCPVLSV